MLLESALFAIIKSTEKTTYLRSFFAIILIIKIASNDNSISTFPDVTLLCLEERYLFTFLFSN